MNYDTRIYKQGCSKDIALGISSSLFGTFQIAFLRINPMVLTLIHTLVFSREKNISILHLRVEPMISPSAISLSIFISVLGQQQPTDEWILISTPQIMELQAF